MNLAAMRAASADFGDYLEQALETIAPEAEPDLTLEQTAIAGGNVTSYIALAHTALERFEEAARGA